MSRTRSNNLIYALDETAEHAGALHDGVRFLLDEIRRGGDRLADRHYGSADDHPGGLACVGIKTQAPRAGDARFLPRLRLLDGVEAHEGLSQGSASTKSS